MAKKDKKSKTKKNILALVKNKIASSTKNINTEYLCFNILIKVLSYGLFLETDYKAILLKN